MADLPRLNNVIRALEAGQHALTCFAPAHVDSNIVATFPAGARYEDVRFVGNRTAVNEIR